jgi:SAM-dependent methyltransferase
MSNNIFNKEYNTYWKNRVLEANDGTAVPASDTIEFLIANLSISEIDKVLDLGCGYGRLYAELSKFSQNIFGIDIDISMINDSSKLPYRSLHSSTAENTTFPENYFDKIIALGVFDVVDQEIAVAELNRILKIGGLAMFTGKNNNYYDDDNAAFVAERNAKLKNFPNHFTDTENLINNLELFGFALDKIVIYERRGDMGNNIKILSKIIYDGPFYEYAIFIKKIKSMEESINEIKFAYEFSETAKKKAEVNKQKNVLDFFKYDQIHNNV